MHLRHKMMKTLAVVLTAVLLAGTFFFSVPAVEKAAAETIRLRVGVLSDVHVGGYSSTGKPQKYWFTKALEWYRSKGVDAILLAGDMTSGFSSDAENERQFKDFADAWFSVFPNNTNPKTKEHVEPIFLYGNHDDGLQQREGKDHLWKKHLKEDYKPVYTKTVKGYKFVCASWGHESQMAGQLDDAVRASKGKPVFYSQHPHPAGTCYGSTTGWGNTASATILKKYPSVVAFSGHSHFPLTDERSIWQDTFTSIGTATLHYVELEPGKEGGSVPPKNQEVKQGSYMTVTDSKINIERHDFFHDEKIGRDWVLDLPLNPKNFRYRMDKRTAAASAPEFSGGSKVTVESVGQGFASLDFPAAVLNSDSDILQSYQVDAVNKTTGRVDSSTAVFSEFYLGKGRLGKSYHATVSKLKPDTKYTLKVYALDCFQKKSKRPLTIDIQTKTDGAGMIDVMTPDVLDVNFLDGTAHDAGPLTTPVHLKGNAKVAYDREIGKNVLVLDGSGDYANCMLTKEQYSSMRRGLTMEVIFKTKDLKKNQAIISCTQNAGIGFEVTGKGDADLWMDMNHKWHTVGGDRMKAPLKDNGYHHLLVTLNNGVLTLYLDGRAVQTSKVIGKRVTFNTDVAFALGADAQPGGEGNIPLNGSIALARLYSHGMTKDQVQVLYENAKSTCSLVTLYNVSNGKLKVYKDSAHKNEIKDLSTIKKNDTVYVVSTPDKGYHEKFLKVNGKDYKNGSALRVNGQQIVKVLYVDKKGEGDTFVPEPSVPDDPSHPSHDNPSHGGSSDDPFSDDPSAEDSADSSSDDDMSSMDESNGEWSSDGTFIPNSSSDQNSSQAGGKKSNVVPIIAVVAALIVAAVGVVVVVLIQRKKKLNGGSDDENQDEE